MKQYLKDRLTPCLNALGVGETSHLTFEKPRQPEHGDLTTNIAMISAKRIGTNPRELAKRIIDQIQIDSSLVDRIEIAGPGFINFHFTDKFYCQQLLEIIAKGSSYGKVNIGSRKKTQIEFVSANPTGPLTVGHGRNAVLGDTLARLLEGTWHRVEREYYFNNAGRQMKVLAASVRARYLETLGRPSEFPEDGYQGDYIRDIARGLVERHGDRLVDHEGNAFRDAAEEAIFADIRATQDRIGVRFDRYFNEDSLYESGAIERVLERLAEGGLSEQREGAIWLKGERVGLACCGVVLRVVALAADFHPQCGRAAHGHDIVEHHRGSHARTRA